MTAPIVWPAILPRPSVSGYGIQPEDSLAATPFDAGPRRVRQRYTAVPSRYTVQWDMSLSQFAVFEYFFAKVLNGGASWYSTPLMQGTGLQSVDARFIGPYAAAASAPKRIGVQATLEVREPPLLSDDAYEIISLYGIDGLGYIDDALNRVMNTSIPGDLT